MSKDPPVSEGALHPLAVAFGVAGVFALVDGIAWADRMEKRTRLFEAAKAAARKKGKPFLVVGCPRGWTAEKGTSSWSRHGDGDYCLDLEHHGCPRPITADVCDLRRIPDNTFGGAFVGCVLEQVNDVRKAFHELHRVTDGPVYVVHAQSWSPFAYGFKDHQWVLLDAPSGSPNLRAVRLRRR